MVKLLPDPWVCQITPPLPSPCSDEANKALSTALLTA